MSPLQPTKKTLVLFATKKDYLLLNQKNKQKKKLKLRKKFPLFFFFFSAFYSPFTNYFCYNYVILKKKKFFFHFYNFNLQLWFFDSVSFCHNLYSGHISNNTFQKIVLQNKKLKFVVFVTKKKKQLLNTFCNHLNFFALFYCLFFFDDTSKITVSIFYKSKSCYRQKKKKFVLFFVCL